MSGLSRRELLARSARLAPALVLPQLVLGACSGDGETTTTQATTQTTTTQTTVPAPDGAGPQRWNAVLFILDDVPTDGMSKMAMLNGRKVSDGSWLDVPNAFAQCPVCLASRAAFLCGRYGRNSGAVNNSSGGKWLEAHASNSLATALQTTGYMTGHFGKYVAPGFPPSGYPTDYVPPGWSKFWADLSGTYLDYERIVGSSADGTRSTTSGETAGYQPDAVHAEANAWLSTVREPFFAQVSYFAPHQNGLDLAPIPAVRHDGLHASTAITRSPAYLESMSDKPAWMKTDYPVPSAKAQAAMDNARRKSWESILSVDESIDTLLTLLSTRGVLDRTLVIVLTDNTRLMHEHNIDGKRVPFDEAANLRMSMRWPGQTARSLTGLVSSVDIAPTIVDVTGSSLAIAPDGLSLRTLVEDTAGWRTALFSEWVQRKSGPPSWTSIRTATEKWTEYADGSRERYDLAADPYELANLAHAGDNGLAAQLARIRPGD